MNNNASYNYINMVTTCFIAYFYSIKFEYYVFLQSCCALSSLRLPDCYREYKNKHAGLKTNTLVALGSAVFVLISLEFAGDKWVDTSRVLSQVVVGIGFLGAGVIWKKNGSIEGLTTTATVWYL